MGFLEFIVGMKWPLTVGLSLWYFKDEIKGIIRRIVKIEGKAGANYLAVQIEQLAEEAQKDTPFLETTRDTLTYEKYQHLLALCGIFMGIHTLDNPDFGLNWHTKKLLSQIKTKLETEGYKDSLMTSYLKVIQALER